MHCVSWLGMGARTDGDVRLHSTELQEGKQAG